MQKNLKTIIKYAVSLLIALALLYFSFKGVKWDDFVKGLKDCRWGYIAVSMAAGILAFYLRGLRWRELLLPIDPSTTRITTFNAVNIGYLANFVFPRIGEFVRCGFVTKNSAKDNQGHKLASYDKVLGTVVLERSWDVVVMFLFLIAILVFGWDRFGSFFVDKMLKPLSESINFSLWWIVLGCILVAVIVTWMLVHFRRTNKICGKICGFFAGIWQGVISCVKMKHAWRFFLYTALIWAMYWTMSASTMMSVSQMSNLGPTDALFLMIAGSLGWFVPVPGGIGAFHYIVALAVSSIYGVPFQLGIIFATLSHESQAITMILCGGVSYGIEAKKLSS